MSIKRPIETTPENLKAIADELQRCAADLSAISEATRDAKFVHLEVTNFGQLKNAVRFSNNFLAAARDALWRAKEQRGDFGTVHDSANNGTTPGRVRSGKKKPEK